jgi:hypothetical protein
MERNEGRRTILIDDADKEKGTRTNNLIVSI